MSTLVSLPNIEIPLEWAEAAKAITFNNSNISVPPVTLVCGPKNSGKTTFSRHLLNTLLTKYKKVAYLDTDVGQPEFTPPGCLSLTVIDEATLDLAVPCLKTPERCYFFGDVSSKRDPGMYLNCIYALYDYYRNEKCLSVGNKNSTATELPLIINTPGWVKGLGYELLVDFLRYIGPTHVVKINVFSGENDLPAGMFWLDNNDASVNLVEITPAHKDSDNRPVLVQKQARLIREFRLVCYFRQCFPSESDITTHKELARALASHPPYQVPIPSIQIKHLYCQVPDTEIFYSLNASIVGLAVSSGDSCLPVCVGLGIIRGIDLLKNLLYLITPVPQSILANVDLLLQGFIQIPTSLLQVQGCTSPYMSANVVPVYYKIKKKSGQVVSKLTSEIDS